MVPSKKFTIWVWLIIATLGLFANSFKAGFTTSADLLAVAQTFNTAMAANK